MVGAVFNTKYQKLEEFRFSRNHFTSNEALYSMLKQREMEKCLFAWETYTDIEKKATACKQPLNSISLSEMWWNKFWRCCTYCTGMAA